MQMKRGRLFVIVKRDTMRVIFSCEAGFLRL